MYPAMYQPLTDSGMSQSGHIAIEGIEYRVSIGSVRVTTEGVTVAEAIGVVYHPRY